MQNDPISAPAHMPETAGGGNVRAEGSQRGVRTASDLPLPVGRRFIERVCAPHSGTAPPSQRRQALRESAGHKISGTAVQQRDKGQWAAINERPDISLFHRT